jgi:hypothetical protein
VQTRRLKLICAVLTSVWMALAPVPAHATGGPAITSIAIGLPAYANTWGFDNHVPLIGLSVLVSGLVLLLLMAGGRRLNRR